MNETKWTPGPWRFGVRRDDSMWLSLGDPKAGPHYQGDLVASPDDARLIVAAPDLLEALEEVVRLSDRKHNAWDKAHAAMAKARGEV